MCYADRLNELKKYFDLEAELTGKLLDIAPTDEITFGALNRGYGAMGLLRMQLFLDEDTNDDAMEAVLTIANREFTVFENKLYEMLDNKQ